MIRVVNIVGTRPNLVKMSAVLAAQNNRPTVFRPYLVHTGQHRHPAMSDQLLTEMDLPNPDVSLTSIGGTQSAQIEHMQIEVERVLRDIRPDVVLVVGDVNSTAAGALAAKAVGIPVAHVEAGLRSFDPEMPEERNRILTDGLSEYLFASEPSGVSNLRNEGRPEASIHLVGNVMIDSLVRFRATALRRQPAARLGVKGAYALLTLHRPANVDSAETLGRLIEIIAQTARLLPVVFPVHPRTRDRLVFTGLTDAMEAIPGLSLTEPLGYLDMLALMEGARVVLTDSGGVQEETTYLGVPCLTLRKVTERPATVSDGTNQVVGSDLPMILRSLQRILAGDIPPPRCPPLWDGRAADRIADILAG